MRYASVCSGVGTCAMAWRPLGWVSAWFSEIAAAPAAILAHRFPEVPNHGDMLAVLAMCERLAGEFAASQGRFLALTADEVSTVDIDLLAGGTPCQAFSIAGQRRSLEDARGNLSLAFCRLVHAIDAVRSARGHAGGLPFVVWENVPGVLSTRDNAFGCFLGGLVGADEPVLPDGGWKRAGLVVGPRRAAAYRVLDAQYFGLAQRRERVVVVSCSRASGYDPAALLLEWEGVRRDSAPSRSAGARAAGTAAAGTGDGSGGGLPVSVVMCGDPLTAHDLMQPITCRNGDPGIVGQPVAYGICRDALDRSGEGEGANAAERSGLGITADVAPTIKARGPGAVAQPAGMPEIAHALTGEGADASEDGTGRGTPLVVQAIPVQVSRLNDADASSGAGTSGTGVGKEHDPAYTLTATHTHAVAQPAQQRMLVRRLMPVECERLQGYPDGHTAVPRGAAGKVMHDGPRYKAIGNGWARPVFAWVGQRIDAAVRP